MSDVAAFVRARLAEDKTVARIAAAERGGGSWEPCDFPSAGVHIARQDPQATLDRAEALRAVMETHRATDVPFGARDQTCVACAGREEDGMGLRYEPWPCPTLRALASAWRRHPDYDQGWGPDQ